MNNCFAESVRQKALAVMGKMQEVAHQVRRAHPSSMLLHCNVIETTCSSKDSTARVPHRDVLQILILHRAGSFADSNATQSWSSLAWDDGKLLDLDATPALTVTALRVPAPTTKASLEEEAGSKFLLQLTRRINRRTRPLINQKFQPSRKSYHARISLSAWKLVLVPAS